MRQTGWLGVLPGRFGRGMTMRRRWSAYALTLALVVGSLGAGAHTDARGNDPSPTRSSFEAIVPALATGVAEARPATAEAPGDAPSPTRSAFEAIGPALATAAAAASPAAAAVSTAATEASPVATEASTATAEARPAEAEASPTTAATSSVAAAASPAATDAPSLETCRTSPRHQDAVLTMLATPAASPVAASPVAASPGAETAALPAPGADLTVASAAAFPSGTPADPATADAIAAVVREAVACLNAGDDLRFLALLSDAALRTLWGDDGGAEAAQLATELATAAATPATALPDGERVDILALWDARIFADGRAGIVAVLQVPGNGDDPVTALYLLADEGGGWRIDGVITVQSAPAGDATPGSDGGQATAATPAPDLSGTGVDGTSYESPAYGYRLAWDDDAWEVDADRTRADAASGDRDVLVLNQTGDALGSLYVEGYPGFDGDPAACLDSAADEIGGSDLDEAGREEADDRAAATYTFVDDDAAEDAAYVECRILLDGEAVVVFTLIAEAAEFEAARAAADDVIASLDTTAVRAPAPFEPCPDRTPIATPQGLGTAENPVPFGSAADVDEWIVRVVSVDPDGPPPPDAGPLFDSGTPEPGERLVDVRLALTYCGTEVVDPFQSLTWDATGPDGESYAGLRAILVCGVRPDDLATVFIMGPGDTAEGTVCLIVPEERVDSLVMSVETTGSYEDWEAGEPVSFALSPPPPAPGATPSGPAPGATPAESEGDAVAR